MLNSFSETFPTVQIERVSERDTEVHVVNKFSFPSR